jgi:NitT/TauT family transport system ATP-binding protein
MSAPIIEISGVSMIFDRQVAVRNFTLSIAPGEVIGLVGQTGAGKTTLLNLILGQIAPTSGTVRVGGCDPLREFNALRGKVAVSFQSDRLIPWRTALENTELGLEILGSTASSLRLHVITSIRTNCREECVNAFRWHAHS